jgi:MoaA/NifB/PqqE/SkfB family radical SAM enzyme
MRRWALPVLARNAILREPTTNVLFVTNRCNLDCAMCFYTERERRDELSLAEIQRLARSMPPQWYLMMTGGEPFLRRDVPDIAAAFYDRGARNLHLQTNATLPDRTLEGVRRIAEHAARANVIVVTSVDGPREVHERIRLQPGVFDRTIETTKELLALKRDLPNLGVVANFTFCAFNQHVWRETFDYLLDEVGVDTVNMGLVRGATKEATARDVDLAEYRAAHEHLVRRRNGRGYFSPAMRHLSSLKERLQVDAIERIARGAPPDGYRCLAGRVFGVITETGDVYPCEMLDRTFGNLRDVDMDYMRLWRGEEARRVVEYIDRRECLCTYECAMGASLAADGLGTARRILELGVELGARALAAR